MKNFVATLLVLFLSVPTAMTGDVYRFGIEGSIHADVDSFQSAEFRNQRILRSEGNF